MGEGRGRDRTWQRRGAAGPIFRLGDGKTVADTSGSQSTYVPRATDAWIKTDSPSRPAADCRPSCAGSVASRDLVEGEGSRITCRAAARRTRSSVPADGQDVGTAVDPRDVNQSETGPPSWRKGAGSGNLWTGTLAPATCVRRTTALGMVSQPFITKALLVVLVITEAAPTAPHTGTRTDRALASQRPPHPGGVGWRRTIRSELHCSRSKLHCSPRSQMLAPRFEGVFSCHRQVRSLLVAADGNGLRVRLQTGTPQLQVNKIQGTGC